MPIIQNLTSKNLPLDEDKARKMKKIYAKYTLVARKLYIIGRSTQMLRCLCMNETRLVLMKVCIGVSGIHTGGRTFLNELLRVEYYWITFPTVNIDFVKKMQHVSAIFDLCHTPVKVLHLVTSTWPFNIWGVDIMGQFVLALGNQNSYLQVGLLY